MRLSVILCSLLATFGSAATAAATLTLDDLLPGDLQVTEYLANPLGVADTAGEYFEIHNTRGEPVDAAGLLVRDDGSNNFVVAALTIAPGGFAVLANSGGSDLGIAVDYDYGAGMSLTNTADEIVLEDGTGRQLFGVAWLDGDAFGAGVAHELRQVDPARTTALGPGLGGDFMAAVAALPLGNFGSPGTAGGTALAAGTVPLPGSAWLLATALGLLARWRGGRPPAAARAR